MWLLDKMLRKLVRKGELTIIDHRGKAYRYGAPDSEVRPVTAGQPTSAPQLNTRPSQACGHQVMRFMKG